MKKLIFLGACLVALGSQPVRAQTGAADVVVVRVSYVFKGHATIATSYGAGNTQVKEIDLPSGEAKSTAAVTEACQQIIAALIQQGYSVKGMSGGDSITLLVLTKQK